MRILPSASFSLLMISTSANSGLGAAPPYTPECRSLFAPCASISVYTKPRSPTHSVGRSGANSSVSVTSAKSAFSLPELAFFFALKDDAHIDGQLAVARLEQRLKSFELHPELALVVDGAARVNVLIALGGLERRRVPLVQRLGGLHVVVRVTQRRGLVRGVQPVRINRSEEHTSELQSL